MEFFRRSLLYRLPENERSSLPAAWRVPVGQSHSTAAFVSAIESEISAIDQGIEDVWRAQVSGADDCRPSLVVDPMDLRLEASIGYGETDSTAVLKLALGTVLAFDDLTLLALTDPQVLAPSRGALRLLATRPDGNWLGVVGAYQDFDQRYADYSNVLSGPEIDMGALTHSLPSTPWRLLQASLLSELMIAFALLHERVHFGLCHLDLLTAAELSPSGPIRMSETSGETVNPDLPVGTRRVLELQADFQAYLLLCEYALAPEGPCARYSAQMDDLDLPLDDAILSSMDFPSSIRVCLTAASLACLAFMAAKPARSVKDPTHPHPHLRLMSMVIGTPILSPLVGGDEPGAFSLFTRDCIDEDGMESEDFLDLTVQILGLALGDLHLASSTLGYPFSPARRSTKRQSWTAAPWIKDLRCFWISDDVSAHRAPTTQMAKELQFLLSVQASLEGPLRALQRKRFGAELCVHVDAGR